MCFSAPASFTAAAVLAGAGAASLAQRPSLRLLPFASIPLIFAVHQAIEGLIWLSINRGADPPEMLAGAYLFIAQVFWPTFTPLAVLALEREPRRRRALWALLAAGVLVSAILAQILLAHPYEARATGHGLRYATEAGGEAHIVGLYALTTIAPLLISQYRYVLMFGIAVLVGAVVTEIFFYRAAASVWCFFAAIASVFVLLETRQARQSSTPTARPKSL